MNEKAEAVRVLAFLNIVAFFHEYINENKKLEIDFLKGKIKYVNLCSQKKLMVFQI